MHPGIRAHEFNECRRAVQDAEETSRRRIELRLGRETATEASIFSLFSVRQRLIWTLQGMRAQQSWNFGKKRLMFASLCLRRLGHVVIGLWSNLERAAHDQRLMGLRLSLSRRYRPQNHGRAAEIPSPTFAPCFGQYFIS